MADRAQPPPGAGEGRRPLRADRGRGRGHRAGRAHDVQVRDRRRAVRRRQGRREDRHQAVLGRGPREDHPPLHGGADQEELHGPRRRRAGARLRDRATRDGVDGRHLRRLLSGGRRPARVRDREARHAGRHPRPRGGHRAWRVLRLARSVRRRRRHEAARPRARARGQARGRAGPWQRRLSHGVLLPGGRLRDHRAGRTRRRHPPARGPRRRGGRQAPEGDGIDPELPRREESDADPARARARVRHPDPGRTREPAHR